MITRTITILILCLSITVFAGNLKVSTVNIKTDQPLANALISLKNTDNHKVYRKETKDGKVEFEKLISGNYLIKAEKKDFNRKTGKLFLDFNKKKTYNASFKLVPDSNESKNELDIKNLFPKNSQYYKTIKKAEKFEKNNSNIEELGILRSNIAFGLYEKSLSENNSKLFDLAYQYAESGTELTPLSSYTWEVFGIINSSITDSYKASIISEDAFETCLKLDPKNTKAMKLLADIYYRNESFKKAASLIEEKIIIENKSPISSDLALLNLCYIRGNAIEQGITFLSFIIKKYPNNQYIKLQLSILYKYSKNKKAAIRLLNSVILSKKADTQQKDYAKKLLLMNK